MRQNTTRNLVLLAVIIGWLVIYVMYRTPQYTKMETVALGTFVEVTYPQQDEGRERLIRQRITRILASVNETMSVYEPSSEVSVLNREGKVVAGDDLVYVMHRALEASKISRGAFDVTVQPLIEMWEQAKNTQTFPDKESVKRISSLVDYRKISIEGDTIALQDSGMKVNLGGIAKGYAIDRIACFLRDQGIVNALINIGGDIRAVGVGPDSRGWAIGIAHPRKKGSHIATLRLKDTAVATSGDYERYYMLDGKRISHIVDPRTGYTVAEVPVSVTVLANSATEADAMATAIFVLGPKEGIRLIDNLPNTDAFVIDADGNTFYSQDWPGTRLGRIGISG